MRHVPHLYLPGPWEAPELSLSDAHVRHLSSVLRLAAGVAVTYTDGAGSRGDGWFRGDRIERGEELGSSPMSPQVVVASAPPRTSARLRFLVEKLAELGVDRLIWLQTRLGEGRPPRIDKATAWAEAALEQSRGTWLMGLEGPVPLAQLDSSTLWVAERESEPPPSVVNGGTLVIGPEAGFAEGEIPAAARRFSLGSRVLRVETAAIAGATVLLEKSGRLSQ